MDSPEPGRIFQVKILGLPHTRGGLLPGARARNFLFSFFLDSYILIVYRDRHDESGV
jgi:hypothetical protein